MIILAAALVAGIASPPPFRSAMARPPVARPAQNDRGHRSGIHFLWGEHPSIRAGSALRVDFQGKLQWDRRRAGDDPAQFDEAELHRARIGIDGTVFRHLRFSVERELTERESEQRRSFRGAPSTAWKDA